MVTAGPRRHRVTLRKFTEGQSSSGAVILTPVTFATVWAEKVSENGAESFRESQIQGWAPVIWRTLYFQEADKKEPTVKWELLEGVRAYDIVAVRQIGYRQGWEFVTKARAEDQR